MRGIRIGKRTITSAGPLYFIADIASNHDGDLERAFRLIELAKESGAHAAKFQNFKAEKLVSKTGFESLGSKSNQADWKKPVFESYRDASIPLSWTEKLKNKCDEVGIDYFTSAYDFESVDAVDPFLDVYKIGSGDITWLDILEYTAKKRKPIILATGASSMKDVESAMTVLMKYTNDIVLMQCNTNYTASLDNFRHINLNVLKAFSRKFPLAILGLSDHTPGHSTVLGAVALGAVFIEKHFTDDNSRDGQDHKFAMNPKDWREMVDRAGEVHLALGDGIKKIEDNELETAYSYKRAIRAKIDLKAGTFISDDVMDFLRPMEDGGLPPYRSKDIVGLKLIRDVKMGEIISFEDLDLS